MSLSSNRILVEISSVGKARMSSGKSEKSSSGGGWLSGVVSISLEALLLASSLEPVTSFSGFFSGFPEGLGFGGGAEDDMIMWRYG